MGNRHRNMYYATGLPGWMRFGYSPGWGGLPRGGGFFPASSWSTPQAAGAWQSGRMQPGQVGATYGPIGQAYGTSPEEELNFLRNQTSALEQQLDQILKRINEIEKAKEK